MSRSATQRTPAGDALVEVPLRALPLDQFDSVLDAAGVQRLHAAVAAARPAFAGRTVWNVNSTQHGGGVAEMLTTLLALARGAGVDARWLVVRGDEPFFRLTKRLHNRLHGAIGDGGPLGPAEREAYEAAVAPAAAALPALTGPGDVVILHDPQTAGLIPELTAQGIDVVWRVHIGVDEPGDLARSAWQFLAPYVQAADVCVFSRPSFAWDVIPESRRVFISPSIDPFAPKNEELDGDTTTASSPQQACSTARPAARGPCSRGSTALGARSAAARRWTASARSSRAIPSSSRCPAGMRSRTPSVSLRASRGTSPRTATRTWSMPGPPSRPSSTIRRAPRSSKRFVACAVASRPASASASTSSCCRWRTPRRTRRSSTRCSEARRSWCRRAWRRASGSRWPRPCGRRVPSWPAPSEGIQDQIEHERSGLLLSDPRDGAAFGAAVLRLLRDPEEAVALGHAARERVRHQFLSDRSLVEYLTLLAPLVAR